MRRFAVLAAAVALLLPACGGGDAAPTDLATVNALPADSGMTPADNGFTFRNFGSEGTDEMFNALDLVEMFGSTACTDGKTDPCVPTTQAAAWARMVNETRTTGHCEGLVVQASQRFNAKQSPFTSKLQRGPELDHAIIRAFATQFLPEVQDATRVWEKKSLGDLVNELVSVLSKGTAPYVLGVTSDAGGHAVLPYAIEFPQKTLAVVKVYDPNWPGAERYVVIDLKADKWYFSFSGSDPQSDTCAWAGGPGEITLTPMDARLTASCPFCGRKSTVTRNLLVIRSASRGWSVTTSSGTYTGSNTDSIEGISGHAIHTGTCSKDTKLPEFLLSMESPEFSLTLPDDSSVYVSNGKSVVHVRTKGSQKRMPITFTDTGVKVADTTTTLTVAADNLAAVIDVPDASVTFQDQKINVEVTNKGKQEEIVVTPKEPSRRIEVENGAVATSDASKETSSVSAKNDAAAITPVTTTTVAQSGKPAATTAPPVVTIPSLTPAASTVASAAPSASVTTVASTGTVGTTQSTSTTTNVRLTTPSTASTAAVTSTTSTTTTIPVPVVKYSIPDGEGTSGQSWGNVSWSDPTNPNNSDLASCGPGRASLCHNFSFRPTLGWDVIVDWALYETVYLYKYKCPGDSSWNIPVDSTGVGSGKKWLMRCEFRSTADATVYIARQ